MTDSADIFTEPSDIDVYTLKNLGPLTEMAGIWEGSRSLDIRRARSRRTTIKSDIGCGSRRPAT